MRLLTGAALAARACADLAALWARARELAPGRLRALGTARPPPSSRSVRCPASTPSRPVSSTRWTTRGRPAATRRRASPGSAGSRRSCAGCGRGRRCRCPTSSRTPSACCCSTSRPPPVPGPVGRAHLDAFADVVADFAAGAEVPTLPALLDYLDTAERAEEGFAPGEVEVAPDRVQVLTVHAAKGLEWEIVAVPHLVGQVFPGRKISGSWLTDPSALPVPLRGDAADLPGLDLPAPGADRKVIEAALTAHDEALDDRRLVEERRLFYVAVTRAEHVLLVSGHRWGATGDRPRQPSVFLQEVRDEVATTGVGRVEHWAEEPEFGTHNPATAEPVTAEWPVDPLGARAAAVHAGAELVRAALREQAASGGRPAPVRRPVAARRSGGTGDAGAIRLGSAGLTWSRPTDPADPRAGPPTSTCCSPSGPPPASGRSSRCPPTCR